MDPGDLTTAVWDGDPDAFPTSGPIEAKARFLLRYAILAPSSHNSQPREFTVDGGTVGVHAVEDRWLQVADSDRRELFVSLGCAIETLCLAAAHYDVGSEVSYHGDDDPAATIQLHPDAGPSRPGPNGAFEAITVRRTTHHPFEDRPIPDRDLVALRSWVVEVGVGLHLLTGEGTLDELARLQARADRRQMDDRGYRRELGRWIGNGALGASWLKARVGQAVVTHLDIGDREAQKNSTLVTSAPVVGVLTSGSSSPTARVQVGQVFQRLSLGARAAGIAVHPMSQILERPETREDLTALLPGEDQAQHLFRLGYATASESHTPRWPVTTVLRDS
ncbi:MAG: hypothetical protein V5A43_02390 [Haloarculaceae archaeon]